MTEEQKRILRDALWRIANELRGKMDADEFRDYILGFIFFKYLSERCCQSNRNWSPIGASVARPVRL